MLFTAIIYHKTYILLLCLKYYFFSVL